MAKQASTKPPPKVIDKEASVAGTEVSISVWEQDPGSGSQPDGGTLIRRPAPKLNKAPYRTVIQNPSPAPVAKVYSPGTAEFRYWTAADALRRGSDFWGKLLPGMSWQVGNQLPVDLNYGVDFNAFYDRIGLRFFHATVSNRTVFSCESPDVVCHELGHAILDSFKPQLWDAASIEVGAFHESFGDVSAILCGLQLQTLRQTLLAETGGVLFRSSRLSRVAEQLGWAIRQVNPTVVEQDCLRNAVNSFFYRNPDTIPSIGPATTLSSEPHSFSRVFTSAFFEGLAGMFRLRPAQDELNLLQVSQDIGQILVGGVRTAAVVPTFFSQVAVNMINTANAHFANVPYGQALRSAFVKHGIISPATSVAFAQPTNAAGIMAAASANEPIELPTLRVSCAEYDLGVDTIVVHSAAEAKRYDVAGAALAIGSVVPPAQDEAAKAFLEDLLRRGHLNTDLLTTNKNSSMAMTTRANEPTTHKTYTHELRREGNDVVLRRVRIDCGFHAKG